MSGMVGWVDFGRDLTQQADVLERMNATMQRRGPHGKGSWLSQNAALGHRALSIGATSQTLPMVVETAHGAVALVYVGEIYNAVELKKELETLGNCFAIGSPAEVLLHGYLRWESRLASRLDGMFAFAVWDGRNRSLLLGRDRLGMKPLYYLPYSQGVLFATEPKGIMANPLFEPRLDFDALPILLNPRLASPGETGLRGLRELPPANVLCYSQRTTELRPYWRLASRPHREPFEETARTVRALLENCIARQVTTGAAHSAMLSGGLDSTCVASLAVEALRSKDPGARLSTYCVQFESDSQHFTPTSLRPEIDAPYAAAAAHFIGSDHTALELPLTRVLDAVPETRRARDLPGWGQFDASMQVLFKEMRETSQLALTGEAADELFGGYPFFFDAAVIARDDFPWIGDGPKLANCLSPDLLARIKPVEDERARYAKQLADVPMLPGEDAANARMRQITYLGMAGRLAVLLDRIDRMAGSVGFEVRLPFCDHQLLEYVWNVPWSMKSAGGMKALLKAAVADVVPPGTLLRQKSAYPHMQNPDYDAVLISEAAASVNDKRSSVAWLFDPVKINRLLDDIRAGEIGQKALPGGVRAPELLIHIVELRRWIDDYRVSLR